MIHDFAMWRGDRAFVRSLLPGARAVLDRFVGDADADELVQSPQGWNFGVPPGGQAGQVSGVHNWHVVYTWQKLAELEAYAGESELAGRAGRRAQTLADSVRKAFWDEARGLFADDLEHLRYSEHAQCMAVLSEHLTPQELLRIARHLPTDGDLTRCSSYYSHYLFETCSRLGRHEVIWQHLTKWRAAVERGHTTFPETFGQTRSDCHAWSAHPLYHLLATVLGVRPVAMGFETVAIFPQLGELRWASAAVAHPRGPIEIKVSRQGDQMQADITLPAGLHGTLETRAQTLPLRPGRHELNWQSTAGPII